jgi:molybdenum cofactor biosynthesis enzyme MoaA
MHEMNVEGRLSSLSIFVGTGQCNASCGHCAGKPLRKNAPSEDGAIDKELIWKTLAACHEKGARYLSISSCGEPTLSPLSVTMALSLAYSLAQFGVSYSPINLYTNGIRIGEDKYFCDKYLPSWKFYGLTTAYLTVHDTDIKKNAEIYGRDNYPHLETIVFRIHAAKLNVRGNLVLSNKTIGTQEKFSSTVEQLRKIGIDSISAWPIRGLDDKVDQLLSPSEYELDKMEFWAKEYQNNGFDIRVLRENSKMLYQTSQKLTLFPDGTLSNTWCNY